MDSKETLHGAVEVACNSCSGQGEADLKSDSTLDEKILRRPASTHEDTIGKPQSSPTIKSEADIEAQPASQPGSPDDAPYHIFSSRTKAALMVSAGFMAMVSPLTAAVYYPAINDIARDLDTSVTLVNLTITTYMIFQGIVPSFVGSFSDVYGRRPAYFFCYTVYTAANIGLALQNSYAALLVLRCLQSAGSSGTIALASATVADLSTRAERGKWIAFATLGITVGPALGPLIGGALTQSLGWRSIFWFLSIMSGALLLFTILVIPESCRAVTGNGSIPPPRWNRSILAIIQQRSAKKEGVLQPEAKPEAPRRKRPTPLQSVRILFEKESGFLLLFGGLTNAGYFLTLSTLTSELATRYGYDALQIGLCYLPVGIGSMTSRWTGGTLLDKNFRRWARKEGLVMVKNRQQDISNFPVERARLGVMIPMVYSGAVCLITYGWVMNFHTHIAGPLVVLFFLGHSLGAANSSMSALIVDINKDSPATATAASNLTRCLFGAGAVAFASPLINAISIGWTGTLVALIWVVLSPLLWLIYLRGLAWRQAAIARTGRDSA